jgi:outer membrane murein-binding lipoprotein Lpp
MAPSDASSPASSTARFRSATEFPKHIESLDRAEANRLYGEMRDCLIFTNRSRSQLIRRNEEHKQKTQQLMADVVRLNSAIQQLSLDKEQLTQHNQAIVADLEQEIRTISTHMTSLSEAFEGVADLSNPMAVMASPSRFMRFFQAIRSIVLWWRQDQDDNPGIARLAQANTVTLDSDDSEDNRSDRPQMYTDPASVNRSLLEDS